MLLAIPLFLLVGVSLGLLGGGGSILTVPILVYALGLPAKSAIATSLLVVGVTSAAAAVAHARAGNVRWRTAGLFGAAGMAGALLGGKLAAWIPGELLLGSFAVVMLATAVAMLRQSRSAPAPGPGKAGELEPVRAIVDGVLVGLVTGMVGAGGGFLVVPALVLVGGLPMRVAVGTSLVVIAMKAFAGFAGYAGHVSIDWPLAAVVTGMAVAGSLIGGRLATRIDPDRLRHGFAWFVLAMAVFVLGMQLPPAWKAILVTHAPVLLPLAGGMLIGLAAAALLVLNGRVLGVSGIVRGLLVPQRGDILWRAVFVAGLVTGGVVTALVWPAAFSGGMGRSPGLLLAAGALVGVGTTLANGCTSGHGVCGVSRLSPRSLVATGSFMAAGALTVYIAKLVLGGMS